MSEALPGRWRAPAAVALKSSTREGVSLERGEKVVPGRGRGIVGDTLPGRSILCTT